MLTSFQDQDHRLLPRILSFKMDKSHGDQEIEFIRSGFGCQTFLIAEITGAMAGDPIFCYTGIGDVKKKMAVSVQFFEGAWP